MKTKMPQEKQMKEKIEEILKNRILDITDEYKGVKREVGISVFIGYPAKIIDQFLELFDYEKQKMVEEIEKNNCGVLGGSILIPRPDWERIKKVGSIKK